MADKDKSIVGNNVYQMWLNYLYEEIDKQRLKAIMQLNAATLQHYWWLGNLTSHFCKYHLQNCRKYQFCKRDLQNLRYRLTEDLCKCRLHKSPGITIFQ